MSACVDTIRHSARAFFTTLERGCRARSSCFYGACAKLYMLRWFALCVSVLVTEKPHHSSITVCTGTHNWANPTNPPDHPPCDLAFRSQAFAWVSNVTIPSSFPPSFYLRYVDTCLFAYYEVSVLVTDLDPKCALQNMQLRCTRSSRLHAHRAASARWQSSPSFTAF